MIELIKTGPYELIETRSQTKVLYLGTNAYAWIEPANIGEILVFTRKHHKTDCVLSLGDYKIYRVEDEPYLSDLIHLELEVGGGRWQGYLLLTGLPDISKKRARIIPTEEVISEHSKFEISATLDKDKVSA